jgi:plasmid maintenance system antidote protein VapI
MAFQLAECLLPKLLKKINMSQAEFARRLGVTRQYIHKLIIGTSTMSLEMAVNAAFILECQVNDLYKIIYVSNRKE